MLWSVPRSNYWFESWHRPGSDSGVRHRPRQAHPQVSEQDFGRAKLTHLLVKSCSLFLTMGGLGVVSATRIRRRGALGQLGRLHRDGASKDIPQSQPRLESGLSSSSDELRGCTAASNRIVRLGFQGADHGEELGQRTQTTGTDSQGERESVEPRHGWPESGSRRGAHSPQRTGSCTLSEPQRALCAVPRAAHWLQSRTRLFPSTGSTRNDAKLDRILKLRDASEITKTCTQQHLLVWPSSRLQMTSTERHARQQGFWPGKVKQSIAPLAQVCEL